MSESAGRLPLELPGSGSARLFGDDSLARRAAGGDSVPSRRSIERHHQELYRYCRAILGDPDDAQDALQATMVKALRSLPGEQREIALKPWLFRIAHNEAISDRAARRHAGALDPEPPTRSRRRSSRRRPASGCASWCATSTTFRSASAARW